MTTGVVEQLFTLRPRDESQPLWSPMQYYQETSGSVTVTVNSAVIQPPLDKIWWITGVYGLAKGTVGVVPESIRFNLISLPAAVGILQAIAGTRWDQLPAGTTGIFSQRVEALAIGGYSGVRATFGFDVGDAANVQHWSFYGYETPKGNVLV